MSVEKLLRKYQKEISGWMKTKDGRLVIYVKPGYSLPVDLLMGLKSSGVDYEVKYTEIRLMSGQFFRPWGGVNGALCSPPLGGLTCHHCASPQSNDDRTGQEGVVYDANTLKAAGSVKILKDFSFKPANIFEEIVAFIEWLFTKKYPVNKFDFAQVENFEDNGRTKVGVIFAGPADGSIAIAYNIANVPLNLENTDSIEKHLDDTLHATVLHYESQDFHCIIERTYKVVGTGAVNVFAYNSVYKFEPVYYLQADPTVCNGKTITESVRPGYSGSVLYI
ncbi:MAG: hypothetical protein ACP5I3_09030 [Thermoproteus sp.]